MFVLVIVVAVAVVVVVGFVVVVVVVAVWCWLPSKTRERKDNDRRARQARREKESMGWMDTLPPNALMNVRTLREKMKKSVDREEHLVSSQCPGGGGGVVKQRWRTGAGTRAVLRF